MNKEQMGAFVDSYLRGLTAMSRFMIREGYYNEAQGVLWAVLDLVAVKYPDVNYWETSEGSVAERLLAEIEETGTCLK